MQFLRKLLDFYIKSSIHVGIAVFCLVYITAVSNDLYKHIIYPTCVFLGTIVCYNFLKYFEVVYSKRVDFRRLSGIILITIIAGIGYLFLFIGLQRSVQFHLFVIGLLVLIYPFLRKFALLKIGLVALCITLITVQIPYLAVKILSVDYYLNLIQRFIFVLIWIIPFEISDSKSDANSLNTIVQKYGIQRSKLFGMLLVIPFLILEFLKVHSSFSVIPIGLSLVLFLHFSSEKRNDYYASFWLESIPVFWLMLLLIFG